MTQGGIPKLALEILRTNTWAMRLSVNPSSGLCTGNRYEVYEISRPEVAGVRIDEAMLQRLAVVAGAPATGSTLTAI